MSTLTKDEFIKRHLVENSYFNTRFKELLYKFGLKENKCEICGISSWNDKPLVCQVHHINGNRTDNRIDNLQILCPNCHSQTENYMSKNTFHYNGHDRICKNCGKPFIARGEGQYFCSQKCLKKYTSRHQRSKSTPYTKEYLQELCNKYNTLDEIGFILHRTRVTVKRYLIMHGLFEEFMRKRSFHSAPIEQLDLNGNVIKEWPSIIDAQETLKVYHIGMVCKGQRKSAGGFLWKYKENNNNLEDEEISSESSMPSVEILQYDLEGNFIKVFDNVEEASKETGTHKRSLILCMQGLCSQANNYLWRYKEGDIPSRIDVPIIKYVSRTPVQKCDIKGNVIQEFSSIKEAAKSTGLSESNIKQCLRGTTKSAGGYIWKYMNYTRKPLDIEIINRSNPTKIFQPKVKVLQYNLDGQFLKEYESMKAASEETGTHHSDIAQCITAHRDRAGNFMWRPKEDNIPLQIAPYKERPRRAKPVLQYDKDGNFVREYISVKEASDINNFRWATLAKYLSDGSGLYRNYIWRYK